MGGLGSLAQLGNQSIGQSIGFGIGRAQQNDAWDIWKKSLLRGPSYRAQGLEAAGINRIIAAGGGAWSTNAGSLIKANTASGSPGSTNPDIAQKQGGLLKAQTGAANASASASNAQATLADTNAEIVSQGLPRARALAEYYSTPTGAATAIQGEVNTALPNTLTGAGIKGAYNAREVINRMFQPIDPGQRSTNPIVPRGNVK